MYLFKYKDFNLLRKYDYSLSKKDLFYEEAIKKNSVVNNKSRKIIYDKMLNGLYLCNLNISKSGDLLNIKYLSYNFSLLSCGDNLYYLVYTDAPTYYTKNVLYTFMIDTNSYIDITKYDYIYKDPILYYLYKEKKYSKHFYCDNVLSLELLNSNFYNKTILKDDVVGICNNTFYLNSNATKKYIHYHKTSSSSTWEILKKENIDNSDQKYEIIDLLTFVNEALKIKEFSNYDIYGELKFIPTYNGTFVAIKENDEIISAACLEKIGLNYIYVSYLFTNEKYQNKGYATKLLKAIDHIAFKVDKKIVLQAINEKNINFYKKKGFITDTRFIDSDIQE